MNFPTSGKCLLVIFKNISLLSSTSVFTSIFTSAISPVTPESPVPPASSPPISPPPPAPPPTPTTAFVFALTGSHEYSSRFIRCFLRTLVKKTLGIFSSSMKIFQR